MKAQIIVSKTNIQSYINALFIVLTLVLFSTCANPIPPTGGAKDTTSPIIVSITNKTTANQTHIKIVFTENISKTGALMVSPKKRYPTMDENKTIVSIKMNALYLTVPSITSSIYLNAFIVDLNEKNKINQPSLLLTTDTGEVNIQLIKYGDQDKKKQDHIFIHTDSLEYNSQNHKTHKYQFQGLPSNNHLTYAIENDNNSTIDVNEGYNVFYTSNSCIDTIAVALYPPHKRYNNYFRYNDSFYGVIGAPFYAQWLEQSDLFIDHDTLLHCINSSSTIMSNLNIDTFTKVKKTLRPVSNYKIAIIDRDTFTSSLAYYGFNHNQYHHKYSKKSTDTLKTNLDYMSTLEIKSNNIDTIMVQIKNKMYDYILKVNGRDSVKIIIPEGQYQILSWINITSGNNNHYQLLNIDGYNFIEKKPLATQELFHQLKDLVTIKRNLENTLILPDINMYNTGVTSQ